jgi:SOS-response transcriptional repressors (RecA-mediated autopeptidases)
MNKNNIDIPIASSSVHAGFPSPAEDFMDDSLNLNKELISHPSATFFIRVEGESMKDAEIHTGDLLIVDRAILPYDGCIAVCYIDGEFTLKRIKIIIDKATKKEK